MKTTKLILLLLSALLIVVGCKKTDPDILTPESLAGEWKRTGDAVGTEVWTLINTDSTGKVAFFTVGKLAPSFIQFHWESKGKILTLTDYATGANIICEITKRTKDELQMNVTYPWDPGNKKQETWLRENFKANFSTPHITLTTEILSTKQVIFEIKAADSDQANVWIDLNNNGIKDPGESEIEFEWGKTYIYSTQTITIYGKTTYLDCGSQKFTALDVSKNPVLEHLKCEKNELKKLDVTNNLALKHLKCNSNRLNSLDVSKNTKLEYLECDGNNLKNLDVTNNPALIELYCPVNPLEKLDISKNTKLNKLYCAQNQLQVAALHKIIDDLPMREPADNAKAYLYMNPGTNSITDAYKKKGKNKNWEIIYVAK